MKRKRSQKALPVEEVVVEEPEQKLKRFKNAYKNKQHTLILSSRGISYRDRHLMNDLRGLMPHTKTDVKYDAKGQLTEINEIADMKNCTNCIFFEARKKKDLYLWFAKTPNGPSAKFHLTNVHTMNELKFTGNSLKGSRPIISFDKSFDSAPHLKVLKELFSQVFGTPKMHPKSKPFIDHVIMLGITGTRIWFRNYQIVEEFLPQNPTNLKDETTLMEIGPRFVMNLVKILSGSFTGAVLFENPSFISPNQLRSATKNAKSMKFIQKMMIKEKAEANRETHRVAPDALDFVFTDPEAKPQKEEESDDSEDVGDEGEEGDEDSDEEEGDEDSESN